MRKVDMLGRIVIPLELRKKYGITDGGRVEFIDAGDGITVKPSEPFCKICRSRISEGERLPLCEACIKEVIESYSERKI